MNEFSGYPAEHETTMRLYSRSLPGNRSDPLLKISRLGGQLPVSVRR
jgi:hypothetical protein